MQDKPYIQYRCIVRTNDNEISASFTYDKDEAIAWYLEWTKSIHTNVLVTVDKMEGEKYWRVLTYHRRDEMGTSRDDD